METITLNNGIKMPATGFGVFQIQDQTQCEQCVVDAVHAGKLRAIGLSNFDSARVMDLTLNNRITPAVNQVECHPFYQQEKTRHFLQEQGIVMEAWASFAEGKKQIFQNETLRKIGAQYGKSPAQVILRWNIQRGIVPLVKSVHLERMKQNLDVFDFTLSDEDMLAISRLDEGVTLFGKNEDPAYAKMINSVKIHGEQ